MFKKLDLIIKLNKLNKARKIIIGEADSLINSGREEQAQPLINLFRGLVDYCDDLKIEYYRNKKD